MAGRQWGNTDNASNSVLWGVTGFNLTPNSVNQTAFYNNTTPNAYLNNGNPMLETVGQFGVSTAEMAVSVGPVNQVVITDAGTGYLGTVLSAIAGDGSSANVTFSSSAGSLSGYTINNGGSGYGYNSTITIYRPQVVFNGNTAVTPNSSIGAFIALPTANSRYNVGDKVTFEGNATSAPITLVDGRDYYIAFANTTGIKLSDSPGTANINFAKASGDNTTAGGATLNGRTATAKIVTGGALHHGVAHAGWVVRKVGTGGRAGRVQYETLVAMGSINPNDSADDAILPNS
jgi:hypothetical protein